MRATARADRRRGGTRLDPGRERAARPADPDTGGVDDRPGMDIELRARELVADVGSIDPWAAMKGAVGADPGRHDGAMLLGRPGHGEGEPRVVLHPVVENERAAEPLSAQRWRVLQ